MKLILNDGTQEHSFEIPPGAMVVGRSGSCHVKLESQRISRRHIECLREGDQVRLRDLGSSNGTYLNGSRIVDTVALKDGDRITIGDINLRFSADKAPPGAAPFAAFASTPSSAADAPDEYSDEEATPPDGTFMPEVYRPHGPPQPILTQRDGRWFINDPRTNREIEIAPKGEAAVIGVEKKKLITYAIIGAASLLAVFLISAALSREQQPVVLPLEEQVSRAQYNNTMDNALKAFEEGKAEQAVASLKQAHADAPKMRAAGILAEILEAFQKSGENMVDLDFEKARSLLDDLERQRVTSKVKAFARSRLIIIDQVQHSLDRITLAHNYEANGNFVKAYEIVKSLSVDNPVRQAHEDYIRQLQDACRLHFAGLGDRARTKGAWDKAIQHYEEAKQYAPSVHHKNEIQEKENECERGKLDQVILADARAQSEAGEYDQAIASIKRIHARSHYAEQAEDLAKQIRQARDREHVSLLYANGQAREAIDYIRRNNVEDVARLAATIANVLEAFDEAQKAHDEGHISDAMAAYKKMMDLEPDENNYYHQLAQQRYTKIKDDKQALAREYKLKGDDAFDNGQIEIARQNWETALSIDGRTASSSLELLDKKARKFYVTGLAEKARPDGGKEKAVELFKKVLRYAKPGSDYHKKAYAEVHSAD